MEQGKILKKQLTLTETEARVQPWEINDTHAV